MNEIYTSEIDKFVRERPDSRLTLLLPKIASLVNKLKPTRVLDYGCGEGHLVPLINAKQILLYDISPEMLSIAKSSFGSKEQCSFLNSLAAKEGSVDVVIMSLVLITMSTEEEMNGALKDAYHMLRSKGKLVIGTTHPAFRDKKFSTFYTNFEAKNYKKDFTPIKVYLETNEGDKIEINDYHKSIACLVRLLSHAGFMISSLTELADVDVGVLKGNTDFPPYLILECEKR